MTVWRKQKRRPHWVERAVLLDLATRLGPIVDRVDRVGRRSVPVRDLLVELVDQGVGSPAELRVALENLSEARLVALPRGFEGTTASALLTDRGLLEARQMRPGVGKPTELSLVLPQKKDAPMFAARFETGDKDRDRKLNNGGLILACFYVIALRQPTRQHPLTIDELEDELPLMAVLGVGPKSGPGNRIESSREGIRDALKDLRSTLRDVLDLSDEEDDRDGRKRITYLAGPFPSVRVRAPRHRKDWENWLVFLDRLRSEIDQRRWLDRARRLGRSDDAGACG